MSPKNTTLSVAEVETLARNALEAAGAAPDSARSLARGIAAAERDGIGSHGLAYLPTYVSHLQCGKVAGSAVPRIERPRPGLVLVDARNGFAHPAIDAGFDELIPLARSQGIAALTVRESYNCGVLGYHTERLAAEDLVGLGFTNAPASIAPVGGKRPVIGTNPFSLAVPDGQGGAAILIDQSASVVAKSEIIVRARRGEEIPQDWALDADGIPTRDPERALKGSMAPAGGYKGVGAGLLTEIMAAVLAGASLGIDAPPFSGTAGGPPRTGQFFVAMDPSASAGAAFSESLGSLVSAFREQDAHVPGDRRHAARARADAQGVAVDAALVEAIAPLLPIKVP